MGNEKFKMKNGEGTANADTPGSFSSSDTDLLANLSSNAFDVNKPAEETTYTGPETGGTAVNLRRQKQVLSALNTAENILSGKTSSSIPGMGSTTARTLQTLGFGNIGDNTTKAFQKNIGNLKTMAQTNPEKAFKTIRRTQRLHSGGTGAERIKKSFNIFGMYKDPKSRK